jgi:hypothetical protein
MKVNLDHFIMAKEGLQRTFVAQNDRDMERAISVVSASTHVPVIVVAFYVGEFLGWPQEVLEIIGRLKKSCRCTEVLGIPESFPKENL